MLQAGFFARAIHRVLEYIGLRRVSRSVLVIGLDNSGKTTIIHQLERLDRPGGFTVGHYPHAPAEFTLEGVQFLLHDPTRLFMGRVPMRGHLWGLFIGSASAVVLVVDAQDDERFEEARELLLTIGRVPELAGKPVLVLGNKVDLPGAVQDPVVLSAALYLPVVGPEGGVGTWGGPLAVRMCSGVRGEGYVEAFRWLAGKLQ